VPSAELDAGNPSPDEWQRLWIDRGVASMSTPEYKTHTNPTYLSFIVTYDLPSARYTQQRLKLGHDLRLSLLDGSLPRNSRIERCGGVERGK
jgi:hypothetical protein